MKLFYRLQNSKWRPSMKTMVSIDWRKEEAFFVCLCFSICNPYFNFLIWRLITIKQPEYEYTFLFRPWIWLNNWGCWGLRRPQKNDLFPVCRICLWQGVLFRGATFGIWQWIGHTESSHYQYKVQPCHSEPKFRTQIGNCWEKPRLEPVCCKKWQKKVPVKKLVWE